MDSPDTSGWPTDLEDHVTGLSTERATGQTTSLAVENGNLAEVYTDSNIASTSSLTDAQAQQLSQGFLNFSFFPTHSGGHSVGQPEAQEIIAEPLPQQQATDIQTFTDALQQQLQLQGLSKDISGWGSLNQKGNLLSNVGTPSTVILSIDGTQQEIPISFHIDPATALGAVQEDQEIPADGVDLEGTYQHFEEVSENYIKSEDQQPTTEQTQQYTSHVQVATALNSDSPVKILTLTLQNKPQGDIEIPHHPEAVELPHHPEAVKLPHHPEAVKLPHHPEAVELPHHPEAVELPHHPEAVELPHHPEAVEFTEPSATVTSIKEVKEVGQHMINRYPQDKPVQNHINKVPETPARISVASRAKDILEDAALEASKYENVRKSSRLQHQVSVARQKNQVAMYDPEVEYNPQQLWCEDCQCSYRTDCPQHKLVPLSDKAVLSRAWASLPSQLQIFRLSESTESPELGVFSKKYIPVRTQFGPFIAETTELKEEQEPSKFPLSIEVDNKVSYLIATDENKCNWMMFVRPAEHFEEQNMVAYQHNDNIFFVTNKVINPKEELKVWYAAHYAHRLNKEPLTRKDSQENCESDGKFECYECEKKLKSMAQLQQHLSEVHDNEGVDGDDPSEVRSEGSQEDEREKQPRDGSNSSFQSWKKRKRNLYFNKIKKYKEMRNRSTARRDNLRKLAPMFKCSHCALVFDSATLLNIHTLMHAADRCDTMQVEEEGAENNIDALAQLSAAAAQINTDAEHTKALAENGLNTEALTCPCCMQAFESTDGLIKHTVVHARTRKLRQNRRNRLYNPQKPYQCPDCIKSFATEDRLNRHRPVHSKDDSFKPLQCEVCFKRFMTPPALACHMKTHSDEKYYTCPICREGFDQMHVLKQHGETHASNGIFPCPDCHKVFYDFNSVRKHMRIYHPYKELPCPVCKKIFPRVDKLKLHMLKHTDRREYMCDQCGRQFKRKDKLREHAKRMHDPQNPKTKRQYNPEAQPKERFIPKVPPSDFHRFIYKCHNCLLGFKRRGMLVNHLAKRHPGTKPDSIPELSLPILRTQRDFFCQYCDKVYKSSSKRKAHILKAHPGAEPPPGGRITEESVQNAYGINCTTFSQLTGSVAIAPHACQFCPKQYASKPKLLQHQRKAHPEQVPPKRAVITATKQVLEKAIESDGTPDLEEKIVELHDMGGTIIVQPEGQTADILTQAMSELTHSFTTDYRPAQPQQPAHSQTPLTPEQQRAKTTEYQISLTGLGGADTGASQTAGIILQPTFVQTPVAGTPGTAAVDLSQILQEITGQEEGLSLSQPIRIISGNQSQTLTVPLTFATQLLSRSIVQSVAK